MKTKEKPSTNATVLSTTRRSPSLQLLDAQARDKGEIGGKQGKDAGAEEARRSSRQSHEKGGDTKVSG